MPDKFVEQAKDELYSEYQEANDIGAMLDQSDTNTRVNDPIVPVAVLEHMTRIAWKGKYQNLLGNLTNCLERLYLGYDGYARTQAIAMAHAKQPPQIGTTDPEKKRGILGLLGK